MDIDFILNTYYNNISTELYPDFYDNDYSNELLPIGYEGYNIAGIYEAKPEVYDILSDNGYAEVYYIKPSMDQLYEEFIGMVIGNELCDVTYFVEDILMSSEFGD